MGNQGSSTPRANYHRRNTTTAGVNPAGPAMAAETAKPMIVETHGKYDSSGSGMRTRYHCRSCAGMTRNSRKENQDGFLICEQIKKSSHVSLFAVMDGHGSNGKLVSKFIQERLLSSINAIPMRHLLKDPSAALVNSFKTVHDQLVQSGINCANSGSTLVTLLRIDKKLWCANAGDSRCVVAWKDPKGSLVIHELSRDHKPDLDEEKERILKSGGVVSPCLDEDGQPIGPARVWIKAKRLTEPGLAMSRSIGDRIAHLIGVSHEAEVLTFDVPEHAEIFVVLASDGVWEFLSSEDVMKIAVESSSMETAVATICHQSEMKWKADEADCDDITVLLINMKSIGPVQGADADNDRHTNLLDIQIEPSAAESAPKEKRRSVSQDPQRSIRTAKESADAPENIEGKLSDDPRGERRVERRPTGDKLASVGGSGRQLERKLTGDSDGRDPSQKNDRKIQRKLTGDREDLEQKLDQVTLTDLSQPERTRSRSRSFDPSDDSKKAERKTSESDNEGTDKEKRERRRSRESRDDDSRKSESEDENKKDGRPRRRTSSMRATQEGSIQEDH